MIPRLDSLAKLLRRTPVAPASVAALLDHQEALSEFRQIVRTLFPDAEAEIWAARAHSGQREIARVWEFLHRVEAEFFPIYQCDEYEEVVRGVPFVRNAWDYERFHQLDLRPGELLLFVFCAYPYDDGGIRLPALDAAEALVSKEILRDIPEDGLAPMTLRERLEGTPYAAAADFAAWLWGETGSVFLDVDDEVEIVDAEWTQEVVQDLVQQWRQAQQILDRIDALEVWIEANPALHFARLLDAALGRDPHMAYVQQRRFYDHEITAQGIVPITHEPADVPLSVGAAC